jgi:hypothetical protein
MTDSVDGAAGMQDPGDGAVGRALGADDRVQHADDAQTAGAELGATESTRKGRSSVLVSRTEPAGS